MTQLLILLPDLHAQRFAVLLDIHVGLLEDNLPAFLPLRNESPAFALRFMLQCAVRHRMAFSRPEVLVNVPAVGAESFTRAAVGGPASARRNIILFVASAQMAVHLLLRINACAFAKVHLSPGPLVRLAKMLHAFSLAQVV